MAHRPAGAAAVQVSWRSRSPTRWRASPGHCWPRAEPIERRSSRQPSSGLYDGEDEVTGPVRSQIAGVMTTLMRNGRGRRSGENPLRATRLIRRVFLIGTRSADYIRASGHSGCIQRPNTWPHPNPSLNCQISSCNAAPSVPWHKAENLGSATTSTAISGVRRRGEPLPRCYCRARGRVSDAGRSRRLRQTLGPASESLQGRNPRAVCSEGTAGAMGIWPRRLGWR